MGKLLGFFKLLLEHKEKVVLGALLIALVWVGVAQWDEIKGGNDNGGKPDPKPRVAPRKPQKFGVPELGNKVPLDDLYKLVNASIFAPPKDGKGGDKGKPKDAVWAQINIRSIFDATQSGSFIAIIDVDNKREFVKEGETFGDYTVKRIDGVRNCLTITRRGSAGSEKQDKEFCKED